MDTGKATYILFVNHFGMLPTGENAKVTGEQLAQAQEIFSIAGNKPSMDRRWARMYRQLEGNLAQGATK